MQLAHQLVKDRSGGRVAFLDNFYTRHVLARKLSSITNGNVKICGTVKFNNIHTLNKPLVKAAINVLQNADRGESIPTQAFNNEKTGASVADNTGYVALKDRKIVVYYCNDLAETPAMQLSN